MTKYEIILLYWSAEDDAFIAEVLGGVRSGRRHESRPPGER